MLRRTNTVVMIAVASGFAIFAGLAGVSNAEEAIIGSTPNDRANHHPIHESVRENQAVTIRLGDDATAVSYWSSAPDGWHVVTTVAVADPDHAATAQPAIVRFSATLVPGQEQLISVPMSVGEPAQALRISRTGDRIEIDKVADPSM